MEDIIQATDRIVQEQEEPEAMAMTETEITRIHMVILVEEISAVSGALVHLASALEEMDTAAMEIQAIREMLPI